MMRVLVTDASGLLGNKVVEASERYRVYPTHQTRFHSQNSVKMDITNESEVMRTRARMVEAI